MSTPTSAAPAAPAPAAPAAPSDPSLIPGGVLPDGSDYDPSVVSDDPLSPGAGNAADPATTDSADPLDPAAPKDPATPDPDAQTFQLGDETVSLADLKEAYGHVQTSVKALRDAKKLDAGARALLDGFKTNPKATLLDVFGALAGNRDQGYATLVELATDILEDAVQTADKPAELREAEKWKAEAAAARAEVERIKEEKRAAAESEATAKATAEWHRDITTALEAGGLPKSDDLVEEVADVLVRAVEAGFRPNLQKAVAHIKAQRAARAAAPIPDDIDISKLPASVLARIRAADLATVKGRQNGSVPAAAPTADPNIVQLPRRARTS